MVLGEKHGTNYLPYTVYHHLFLFYQQSMKLFWEEKMLRLNL